MWRLQKFLTSPAYRLSATEQLGEGKGSRRVFSREGVYRIATALTLLHDGFAPEFIGRAVAQLDEPDFQELDTNGQHARLGILFRRTAKGRQFEFFASGKPPEVKAGGFGVYYALDLGWVMDDVNRRIGERNKSRSTRES